MKTLASTFALALILTTCGSGAAHAQSIGSLSDYLNDYELYVADYETHWYTIVTWDDGRVSEYRSVSQDSAYEWSAWLTQHIVGIDDIDVVSRYEPGEWIYVDTFGTYNAAADEADEWEADGFETDIRSIRVNDISPNGYEPITKPIYKTPTYSLKK